MTDLQSLKAAAERYTKGYPSVTDECHADTIALADFAARVLSGMPELGELPPGVADFAQRRQAIRKDIDAICCIYHTVGEAMFDEVRERLAERIAASLWAG